MADDDTPAWPADALEVGRIVGAWGIKGWFKVMPYSAEPTALLKARHWHLRASDSAAKPPSRAPSGAASGHLPAALAIAAQRRHGEFVVAVAAGVADRAAAEALRGASVFLSRADFPATAADEFYWADLIGLSVVNRDGARLGVIDDLIDTGPHGVLRVQGDAGAEERLIPFVAAYVDSVDLVGKRVVVDWALDY